MNDKVLTKSENTRNKIVETAKEVFCEHGYVATTVNLISKEVGVSYGTVYSYFDNKAVLFIEVMDDTLQELFVMARAPFFPKTVKEAYEIILKQTIAYLSISKSKRRILEIIEEAVNVSPEVREKWRHIREYFLSTITQDISYSQITGLIRDDVVPAIAAMSWYSMNEWHLWECVKKGNDADILQVAENIAKMYVCGIYNADSIF